MKLVHVIIRTDEETDTMFLLEEIEEAFGVDVEFLDECGGEF